MGRVLLKMESVAKSVKKVGVFDKGFKNQSPVSYQSHRRTGHGYLTLLGPITFRHLSVRQDLASFTVCLNLMLFDDRLMYVDSE